MDKPDISIVIVNYNVKQLLLTCLASLYRNSSGFSFEVILVDNASSDGSADEVKNKFPQVKLIENKINLGFPAANNQAFKLTKGNYVLMLNPDTELRDNSLLKLKQYLDENKEISLIGPKLLNPDGTLQYSAWKFPKLKYIVAEMLYLNWLIGNKYYSNNNFSKPFQVDSLSGAAILIRSETLAMLGGLNEKLFWIEDIDLCYRIKKAGMKIVYYPDSEITHHIGQSAKKNYKISISNQVFNKIKFYKIHYASIETATLKLVCFFDSLIRFFIFGILSPFSKVYFKKSAAYLYTLPRIFNPPLSIA